MATLDRAERVAEAANEALLLELSTYPKPGLVSPFDSGSHRDMDAALLRRSARALRPAWAELARAGERGAAMAELRAIGLRAEAAMLRATNGVNAHRGAIFALGLLSAAEGALAYAPSSSLRRTRTVAATWGGSILAEPPSATSHGGRAMARHGVGGARLEAASGFPTIIEIGLPALREGRHLRPGDEMAARVHCVFALLAATDDTNLLHRGGAEGLRLAKLEGRRFLDRGGVASADWFAHALAAHRLFVAAGLSPGGTADLLAATLFLDRLEV